MTNKVFAAAMLIAGMATTGATAKTKAPAPLRASVVCMNLGKANATVKTENNKLVHYTVNAGGDPREIELEFTGADRVYLDLSGHLVMSMRNGDFRTLRATYYQLVDGKKKLISGNFRVLGANHVSFHIGKYNTALPLEIETVIQGNDGFRG